jgi:hypothetical protein
VAVAIAFHDGTERYLVEVGGGRVLEGAAWKAWMAGTAVVVSALFSSNVLTISGKPLESVSSPHVGPGP